MGDQTLEDYLNGTRQLYLHSTGTVSEQYNRPHPCLVRTQDTSANGHCRSTSSLSSGIEVTTYHDIRSSSPHHLSSFVGQSIMGICLATRHGSVFTRESYRRDVCYESQPMSSIAPTNPTPFKRPRLVCPDPFVLLENLEPSTDVHIKDDLTIFK